jgi:hypothetical protein
MCVTVAVTCTDARTASPLMGAEGAWARAAVARLRETATEAAIVRIPLFVIIASPSSPGSTIEIQLLGTDQNRNDRKIWKPL